MKALFLLESSPMAADAKAVKIFRRHASVARDSVGNLNVRRMVVAVAKEAAEHNSEESTTVAVISKMDG